MGHRGFDHRALNPGEERQQGLSVDVQTSLACGHHRDFSSAHIPRATGFSYANAGIDDGPVRVSWRWR